MDNRRMGKKIRIARKNIGYTAEILAEMLDVAPGHIRQIESGRRTPSLPLFIQICETLKVSPNYILEIPDTSGENKELLQQVIKLNPHQQDALNCILKAYIGFEEEQKTE